VIAAFVLAVSVCLAAPNALPPIQPSDSADVVGVMAGFHAALVSGDSLAALGTHCVAETCEWVEDCGNKLVIQSS
jgi:hypothetical protein